MTVQEWGIVVGALVSGLAALAPWMFMVHAKLAVIAAQIEELSQQVEKATENNRELWNSCASHRARLATHDVQFAHIAERLQEL